MFFDYGITGVYGAVPPAGARVIRQDGDVSFFLDEIPMGDPGYAAIRIAKYRGVTFEKQLAMVDLRHTLGAEASSFDIAMIDGKIYAAGFSPTWKFWIVSVDAETMEKTGAVRVGLNYETNLRVSLCAHNGQLILTSSSWFSNEYQRFTFTSGLELTDKGQVSGADSFYPSSCVA
jgi:hypothetical protein